MFDAPSLADLNLEVTLPALFLLLFSTFLLIIDLFIAKERKILTAQLAAGGLVVAFVLNLITFNSGETALGGMFVADEFTGFLNIVILVTAFIGVLISVDYLERTGIEDSEYYSLLLYSTLGMMFMVSANDLITIFVALELLSIPLYVMSAIRHNDPKSEESGMKYFIMGAFASAFFVYGAALVYGATGTTSLPEIFVAIEEIVTGDSTAIFYLLVGTALVFTGLGFKVAAVPFHMWTPDVYEGAPTPVTAFMSVGAKTGGFAALLRIVVFAIPAFVVEPGDSTAAWQTAIWLVAAATMIVGNVVAISQSNVKRMLAYSSIAHAGYLMMAVAAVGTAGVAQAATEAALVYLMAYAFTNLGAFTVVLAIERSDGTGTNLDDFIGLSKSQPLMAAMMAFFMLSLTGVPLTGGFIGKFLVFDAALEADLVPLAIIGVLTSIVSAFYYVRIIVNMYLQDSDTAAPPVGATNYVTWATITAFAGTLILGVLPVLATDLLENMVVAAISMF